MQRTPRLGATRLATNKVRFQHSGNPCAANPRAPRQEGAQGHGHRRRPGWERAGRSLQRPRMGQRARRRRRPRAGNSLQRRQCGPRISTHRIHHSGATRSAHSLRWQLQRGHTSLQRPLAGERSGHSLRRQLTGHRAGPSLRAPEGIVTRRRPRLAGSRERARPRCGESCIL